MQTEYRVKLEAFEGPIDLLLFLIRRAEVDVTDIPIAAITDQYLAYLSQIDRIDIDLAGEFLVMAATLMEIKARMLAPPAPEGETADGAATATEGKPALDPRADLVRQLLAYKRFRDAADALDRRRVEWERRWPVRRLGIDDDALKAAMAEGETDLDLEDLSILDLAQAHARIVATVNFDRLGEHTVLYDETPIELHAADIIDRLRRDDPESRGVELAGLFAGRTRGQMIGLFLATLELVRRRDVAVTQDPETLRITIALRPEVDREMPGASVADTGAERGSGSEASDANTGASRVHGDPGTGSVVAG